MGRDVADGVADAPVAGRVGARAVHQQHVMQRHLARLERHVDAFARRHVDRDLLAARQKVVLVERVAMLDLLLEVAARPEFHRAAFDRRIGEGDPGGDHVVGAQPPIGRVLVPRHEGGRLRLLGEEGRAPAKNIGPDHVLHGIQDRGMPRQLVGPGEEQVNLVAHLAGERAAQGALLFLQPVAIGTRLGRPRARGPGSETRPFR